MDDRVVKEYAFAALDAFREKSGVMIKSPFSGNNMILNTWEMEFQEVDEDGYLIKTPTRYIYVSSVHEFPRTWEILASDGSKIFIIDGIAHARDKIIKMVGVSRWYRGGALDDYQHIVEDICKYLLAVVFSEYQDRLSPSKIFAIHALPHLSSNADILYLCDYIKNTFHDGSKYPIFVRP